MQRYKFIDGSAIILDFERGEIADIICEKRSLASGNSPLFSLKIREKAGNSVVIDSATCHFVNFDGKTAKYSHEKFDAEIVITQTELGLSLRANIINKTKDLLEWIELGSFSVYKKLKDENGGRGEIVYPYNEGCLVTNMEYRESMPFRYIEPDYPSKNSYSIFPNMVFAQFISYFYDGLGIYLGMHDVERTTKHVDFCYKNEGIKIFMRAFCDVGYGENYEMPFDTVLNFIKGDWTDATEFYGKWFNKNLPNGLKKIEQNDSLPSWYSQSPIVVAYPLRGKHDTDVSANGFYPYKNAIPALEKIAGETQSKVMALIMQWEGTAPWAPPYSWPPYGGEEEFSSFVEDLHNKNMLVGLYTSGFGWTKDSKIIDYNCDSQFEKLNIKDALCANSNGEIKSNICSAQRVGYDFCPSTEGAKKIFKEEFEKICKSNIDYLQALDQNHGGNSYFCYSDKHGHTPAPGKWQQKETNGLLSSIDKNGVVFGCESGASEPFLAQLPFSDNRFQLNYYVGKPIPVYAYLYHEYVNNFMGNQICAMLEKKDNNFTYRLAYSFVAGDMLTLVIDGKEEIMHAWCDYVEPKEKTVNKEIALKFIKNLNKWRQNGGKNHLRYGKMIKPIKINSKKERFLLEDQKTYLTVDSVLTSAFEYKGEKAQFIVNYNLKPIDVSFDGSYDVYLDSQLQKVEQNVSSITLEPLSAIMIKLEK